MTNFDPSTRAKLQSVRNAEQLLPTVYATYQLAKTAQGMLQLYQAGTDQVFNAAVNAMLTVAERQELGQMLAQINALVADWEANHPAAILPV